MNTEITLEFDCNSITAIACLSDNEKKIIQYQYETKEFIQSSCCGQTRCFNCLVGGLRISDIVDTDDPTCNEHLLTTILENCYIGVIFKIALFNSPIGIIKTLYIKDTIDYEEFAEIDNLSNKRLKCIGSHNRYDDCILCKCAYYTVEIVSHTNEEIIKFSGMSEKIFSSKVLGDVFVELKDKDEIIKYLPCEEKELIDRVNSIGSVGTFIESNTHKRAILLDNELCYGFTDKKILDYIVQTMDVEKNKFNILVLFLSRAFKSASISSEEKIIFDETNFEQQRKWFQQILENHNLLTDSSHHLLTDPSHHLLTDPSHHDKIISFENITDNTKHLFEDVDCIIEQQFLGLNYNEQSIKVEDLIQYLNDPKIYIC